MNENASSPKLYKILLVEDSDEDVWLTRRAFKKLSAPVELYVSRDGVEALRFLRHEAANVDAPTPDLILLDLNMPKMNGHQLLVELKQDESLRAIPAIVLSTSQAPSDVYSAYSEHAAAYLTKPLYVHEFADKAQCFFDFWLGKAAILPRVQPRH